MSGEIDFRKDGVFAPAVFCMAMLENTSINECYVKGAICSWAFNETELALMHILRALVPGGKLSISVDDISFIAAVFHTKYYGKHNVAINRMVDKRSMYSYPLLAEMLLKLGYVFIEKEVCPFRLLRKVRGKRGNARQPLDTITSYPIPTMVVAGSKPKRNTDPAFRDISEECDELSIQTFALGLRGKGKRILFAEKMIDRKVGNGKNNEDGKGKEKEEVGTING